MAERREYNVDGNNVIVSNVIQEDDGEDVPRNVAIRKFVDPEGKYMSDDEVARILFITGGQEYRATIRCFLGTQARAKKLGGEEGAKDRIKIRNLQRLFEAGILRP